MKAGQKCCLWNLRGDVFTAFERMLTNTCSVKHGGCLMSQHAECKHHSAERGNSISRAESQFQQQQPEVELKEGFAALVVNCRHHVGNIYCREMQLWAKINPEYCCQHLAFRGRCCSRKWDLLRSPGAVMWSSAHELSRTAADFLRKSFTSGEKKLENPEGAEMMAYRRGKDVHVNIQTRGFINKKLLIW